MQFIPDWVYNVLTGKASPAQVESVKDQAAMDIVKASHGKKTYRQAYDEVSPEIDKIAAVNNAEAEKHTFVGVNYSGLVPDGEGPSILKLVIPQLAPDSKRTLIYAGVFGCVVLAVSALRR